MNRAIALLSLTFLALAAACGGSPQAGSSQASGSAQAGLMYRGDDRMDKLVKAAQAEGTLSVYSSNTTMETLAQEFAKKYTFVKVESYRAQANDILSRLSAEVQANKVGGDVLESSDVSIAQANEAGYLQEYWSPDFGAYDETAIKKGPNGGAMFWADRVDYYALGWNTSQVKPEDAPKTLDDLLDPKWKGKMSVVSSSTGVNWVGSLLDNKGPDYFQKLAGQQIRAQNIASVALTNLIASGEVMLSPTSGLADVRRLKQTNAPIDWRPIEPVVASAGMSGVLAKAAHPNMALLFIDYLHSKEGQTFSVSNGNDTPRNDVSTPGGAAGNFAKVNLAVKYSPSEYREKFTQWQDAFKKAFVAS